MNTDTAILRDRIIRSTRDFFHGEGYVEVDTPVRVSVPAQEAFIDAVPSGSMFLRTSPEFHMKRLLCEGMEKIFQIGPCFRDGETGSRHNTEFTMLEWYCSGCDYADILDLTCSYIRHVVASLGESGCFNYSGTDISVTDPWVIRTVSEVFREFAGWDPVASFDQDRFDLDLVTKVEPRLSGRRPVVIKDYPPEAAAFARMRTGSVPVAERWELYIGGLEIANAYSELTSPTEQRARLMAIADERRKAGRPVYVQDEAFLLALERGMPECAGAALGLDRLIMLLTDSDTIEKVRYFCRES